MPRRWLSLNADHYSGGPCGRRHRVQSRPARRFNHPRARCLHPRKTNPRVSYETAEKGANLLQRDVLAILAVLAELRKCFNDDGTPHGRPAAKSVIAITDRLLAWQEATQALNAILDPMTPVKRRRRTRRTGHRFERQP